MVEVVAALITDGNRFLICQRPENKARGLLWEFVGGKIEAGESPEQALIRECQEELAVTVSVDTFYMEVTHQYPDICVHLSLWKAHISAGSITLLEHNDAQWITAEQIPNYEFCPADTEILQHLTNHFII